MQLEQYTADAICHSMSIGPLMDPAWNNGVLAIRLLLKPSFYPEACITITQSGDVSTLAVTVLAEMLWSQPHPCRLPSHHDEIKLTEAQFTRLAAFHHNAVSDPETRHGVCLDGMGMDCAWTKANGCKQFQSNVVGASLRNFVAQMIDEAWRASTNSGVRNGLANCAQYVGAEYPMDPVAPNSTLIRLGVLGAPDEVAEYFQMESGTKKSHNKAT